MPVSADGDGHGVLSVGSQGPVLQVVGERVAAGAQMVDQCRGSRGTGDLADLAWKALVAGEQDR
jgi:hypothetical protein